MVRFVSPLLACLSVVGANTRGDAKFAREGENLKFKPVYIDGDKAALRMGTNEVRLESYSEQVEEAELYYDDIDQVDRFGFVICLEPKIDDDITQECDEPENLDQIMLAVLRAGFMDLDVLFEGIEEVSEEEEGNGRKLGRRRRGKYKYGGYACRRCKKARRKLSQYDTTDGEYNEYDGTEYEDSISDDAIAAKMTGALRIAIIDTLGLDSKSCLFYMMNELLHVDIKFGVDI